METQLTLAMMNDELGQARTSKKEFLGKIESIVPWETFMGIITPCYYKGERGNKPYLDEVPDGDTIGRFRNLLEKNGIQEKIFAAVVKILEERKLILKKGTIVDSTLIDAPSSTKNHP